MNAECCRGNTLAFFVVASLVATPLLAGKPNVLIIVSDDQGYADLNRTGGSIPTPTIDALSYDAHTTWLENFYVHPVCTPTRAALLTGRIAASSGLSGPLLLATPCGLPERHEFGPNLAESLKDRGYKNILAGKWHLGHHAWRDTPTSRGFDVHEGPSTVAAPTSRSDTGTPCAKCRGLAKRQRSCGTAPSKA